MWWISRVGRESHAAYMGQGQKCAKLQRSLNARQGQDEDSSGSLKKSRYTVTKEHSGTVE